jgi:NO-binding membrane sensor protein with MHYT domain
MTQLYTCVTQQHDLRLVAVAALICALGSYATFAMGRQVFRSKVWEERLTWAVTGVIGTSSAIWATHFIATLSFGPGMVTGFAVGPTCASPLVAVLLVGFGAGLVVVRPNLSGRVAGGGVIRRALSALIHMRHITGASAVASVSMAVGSIPSHDLHPPEAQCGRSFLGARAVHSQEGTPDRRPKGPTRTCSDAPTQT